MNFSFANVPPVIEGRARSHRITVDFYANFSCVKEFAHMSEIEKKITRKKETSEFNCEEKIEKKREDLYAITIVYKQVAPSELINIYAKAINLFASQGVYLNLYHYIGDVQTSDIKI